jgi:hypothetical protein
MKSPLSAIVISIAFSIPSDQLGGTARSALTGREAGIREEVPDGAF